MSDQLLIYQIEGAEDEICLSIGSLHLLSVSAHGARGIALLKFEASRRDVAQSPSVSDGKFPWCGAYATAKDHLADAIFQIESLRDRLAQAERQIKQARKAIEPFNKMAAAMYVSGHCGGASPEDWPDRWSISIEGFDGKHLHGIQGHQGAHCLWRAFGDG